MQIRRANKTDLPAIQYLMKKYSHREIVAEDSLINNRDIGLVAYAESGELAGFIWAGFMCKNELVYVDKFVVDPAYARKGVGKALCTKLFKECAKRGAKRGFSVIKQDEYHDKSAMNALKLAAFASDKPFSYIWLDRLNSLSEVKELKE